MKSSPYPGRLVVAIVFPLTIVLGVAQIRDQAPNDSQPNVLTVKPRPLSENILYAQGLAQAAMGQYAAARENFARIREINPESPLGYGTVSRTYQAEGQLDQALRWMRAAHDLEPRNYELAGWMVFLNDSMEDYEAASQWSAWLDGRVTNQAMPMAMQASHHYMAGNFELALQFSNLALKLKLPDRWNSDAIFMRVKRDEALASGDPGSGIDVFLARHPELFIAEPALTPGNIVQATDLALLLKMAGRTRESTSLLESVLDSYDRSFLATGYLQTGLVPVRAEALAILGREREALDELRSIVDRGWRAHWRWKTDLNPNFVGIRQSEEFQAIVEELEIDATRQRSRARNMATHGQYKPAPSPGKISVST